MTWQPQSRRHNELPANWTTLRNIVRTRAHNQCEHINPNGQRCPTAGNQCDHIIRGNNHHPDNLQWLCHEHHATKTAAESHAARAANRANLRHVEPHPGLLRTDRGGYPKP